MTWKLVAEHPIPNTIFDVLAKCFDAGLDRMVLRRITDCFQVCDRVHTATLDGQPLELTKLGLVPVFWMEAPEPPHGYSETVWSTQGLPVANKEK